MAIFLTEQDVRQVLDMPMALAAVESAHLALARGQAQDTPRARTRLPKTALHILQGALPEEGVLGYKAYTSNRSGNRFLVHLFDAESGELQAVLQADFLGMMRTGAASGVAAKWLARPDARLAGVFGTGWQAEGHIEAICTALPGLETVKVYGRKAEKCEDFCARVQPRVKARLVPVGSPEALVRESEVLGTVTTAADPLFDAEWLQAGTHINAAGANALVRQELSEATLRRCDLICVDAVPTALAEAGDLLPLLEKGRLHARQLIELGGIMAGRVAGRQNAAQITLFESQGMAIQDLAVAVRVVAAAKKLGLGTPLFAPIV